MRGCDDGVIPIPPSSQAKGSDHQQSHYNHSLMFHQILHKTAISGQQSAISPPV
jgi:hypothetical protein